MNPSLRANANRLPSGCQSGLPPATSRRAPVPSGDQSGSRPLAITREGPPLAATTRIRPAPARSGSPSSRLLVYAILDPSGDQLGVRLQMQPPELRSHA